MNEPFVALSSLISITFLIVLFFGLYKRYRTEAFRQRLFGLRDELFDYAKNGNMDFDTPAYGILRDTCNGYIRFAHRVSMLQVLVFALIMKRDNVRPYSDRLEKSLTKLSEEQKTFLNKHYMKINLCLVEHLLLSSPSFVLFAFALSLPAILSVVVATKVRSLFSKFDGSMSQLLDLIATRIIDYLAGPIDELDAVALANGASRDFCLQS